jgi:hypothetical protein
MEHQHLICEHISVSRKQTWTECQAKYRFRYHLKMLPEGPIQPYFVYGKVVHKIAEEYVRLQGQTPIEKIAADVLSGDIPTEDNAPPPVLESDYKKKLPDHLKNIKMISDKIGYDGHLEYPFKYDMQPPDGHLITGVIDRLIIRGDKFFILDYKTTKKGLWRKNSSTIGKDLQLRCYARVVQKLFGAKAENIQAALFYLEGANLVSTKFTDESIMSAEEELHDAYKNIISTHPNDVYGRVGDQCRRCDYRKICSFYSLT